MRVGVGRCVGRCVGVGKCVGDIWVYEGVMWIGVCRGLQLMNTFIIPTDIVRIFTSPFIRATKVIVYI